MAPGTAPVIDISALKEQAPTLDYGEAISHPSFSGAESDSGLPNSGADSSDMDDDDAFDELRSTASRTTATVLGGRRSAQLSSRLRQIVIILFVYLAVFTPLVIYIRSRTNEVVSFENEFESLGSQVMSSFGIRFSRLYNAIDSLSIAATSFAINTNRTWPYVTMYDYDLRAQSALALATTGQMTFAPLVTEENRVKWEEYSAANLWWISEAMERTHGDSSEQYLDDVWISDKLYTVDDNINPIPPEGPGPFFPVWQMQPPIPVFINLADYFGDGEILTNGTLTNTSQAVLGALGNWQGTSGPLTELSFQLYTILLQEMLQDPTANYTGEPISNLYYPVFDTFDSNREVVGMFYTTIFWREFFFDMLSDEAGSIICVIANDCGGTVTLEIEGSRAKYLGEGDLHDSEYDYLGKEFKFSQIDDPSIHHFSDTAAPLNKEFCPYVMRLYPSDKLQEDHITNEPLLYALVVVVTFIAFSILSMTYDCVVQSRMRAILKSADENRALVASMFPEAFRDRLFLEQDETPVFSMGAPSKMRLKAMLGQEKKGNEEQSQDLGFLSAKPIADLFPHCTVLFADISGFSAWSSERQPEQVR